MKLQIELTGEVHSILVTVNGKEYKCDANIEDLRKLWMFILEDNKMFEMEDEENGIHTYDEEYDRCHKFPFSIADLVITEHEFSSDAYYHIIDY